MRNLQQFIRLFSGLKRSYFIQSTKGNVFIDRPPTAGDYADHLDGKVGITIVPIREDGMCTFAAIDVDSYRGVDSHRDNQPLDIDHFASVLEAHHIPLVPFATKRGGIHAYWFMPAPVAAPLVRAQLKNWAEVIGLPTSGKGAVEIFPKQNTIADGDNGTGINLPFFGDTRKAYIEGEYVGLDALLRRQYLSTTYADAPPCIQHMVKDGIHAGARNDTLYHISVFLRRKFGDKMANHLRAINSYQLDPLPDDEMDVLIDSVSDKDYNYRCSTYRGEPFCDLKECHTTPHGVPDRPPEAQAKVSEAARQTLKAIKVASSGLPAAEATQDDAPAVPVSMVGYKSDTPSYDITFSDGIVVSRVPLSALFDTHHVMKAYITETIGKVCQQYSAKDWNAIVISLISSCSVVDESDESWLSRWLDAISRKVVDIERESNAKVDTTTKESVGAQLAGTPMVFIRSTDQPEICTVWMTAHGVEQTMRSAGMSEADIKTKGVAMRNKNAPRARVWGYSRSVYRIELTIDVFDISAASPGVSLNAEFDRQQAEARATVRPDDSIAF